MSHPLPARSQWPRLLLAAPRPALLAAHAQAMQSLSARYLALPQNGLALLPLIDGAFHEPFNLGEIPLCRVHLALSDASGREARGAAWVMEDDLPTVEALAVADALLAAQWPQADIFAELLQQGANVIETIDHGRKALLAATTVNFDLFGATGHDDDDDKKDDNDA